MTIDFQNPNNGNAAGTAAQGGVEETLRLIAGLPVPQGLEERVHRRLGEAGALGASGKAGRVLVWPVLSGAGREWMRAVAAAAIAFAIVGGGWGVYRQVQPRQTGNGITLAPHGAGSGGFAGANAVRTPQTLNGPILRSPAPTNPPLHSVDVDAGQASAQTKDAKKNAARGTSGSKGSAGAKSAPQAGTPAIQR